MSDDKKPEQKEQKKEEAVKPAEKAEAKKPEQKEQKKEVKASPKLKKIIEEVEKLTVLELSDLVKALEDKFGVSSTAPAAVAAAPAGETANAPAEEKSEFDVVLTACGANKIAAIKAVREIKPDMGLKEAKDLVEAAPKELLKAADKKTSEEAKKKLETAGCQVELK